VGRAPRESSASPESCSPCGRPLTTSRPSCARPTSSTTPRGTPPGTRPAPATFPGRARPPIWKTAPIRLGVTVVTMILLVAAAVIVVVTGGLAQKVGNVLGLGCGHHLGHREVAGAADHHRPDSRPPVLGQPERPARLPVGQPRRLHRRRALAGCRCPVRRVRRQLQPLQQGLRQPRRRHHLPGLDVDLQRSHPARRRVQRRARARPRCRWRASRRRPARDRRRQPPGRSGVSCQALRHGSVVRPASPATGQCVPWARPAGGRGGILEPVEVLQSL
jgi:hypothetical protein